MFRLIVCAPQRSETGPECLGDVSHHLVLSYRARITDMNISYAKGVFGGYHSQLFIMRFHEIQQEYTKFELRNLHSVPLRFSEGQKEEFIDLTLERYWAYQGRYYFLDNNCGTEVQKHLALALTEDEARLVRSITPLKMYNDIIKRGFSLNQGTRFDSLHGELNQTFNELRSLGFYKEKKMAKFFKKTTPAKRLARYRKIFSSLRFDSTILKRVVMRLIYFERYLLSRYMQELPKKTFKKMKKDPPLRKEVLKMSEEQKLLALQPWEVIESKYGAPVAYEFEEQWPRFVERRKEQARKTLAEQLVDLQSLLGRTPFSKELSQLKDFQEIKQFTNTLFLQTQSI